MQLRHGHDTEDQGNAEHPSGGVAALTVFTPAGGSYLAIANITTGGTPPAAVSRIRDDYRTASASAVFRQKSETERLFSDLELVKLCVEISEWRAYNGKTTKPPALRFIGGVGKKR